MSIPTKPKLPEQGVAEIVFDEKSFNLLAEKLIQHLEVTFLTRINDTTKAKVSVKLTEANRPGVLLGIQTKTDRATGLNIPNNKAVALSGATNVLNTELTTKTWYLFGETTDVAKMPICIAILPGMVSSYALMKKAMPNSNPQAN